MFKCPEFRHPHETMAARNRCMGRYADKKLEAFPTPAMVAHKRFPGVNDLLPSECGKALLPIVRFQWGEIKPWF